MAVVITYGGYDFPYVFSPYKYTQTATDATLEFNTLLSETTSSLLLSSEATLLAAVKKVKQTLLVKFNGTTEFNLSNTNGGFVSKVTAVKMDMPDLATETTRPYRISISYQLPYTQDSGKISANWVLTKSASKQSTFQFNATYSASDASPAVDATTVAKNDFFTWCESIITAFKDTGEIYERISDTLSTDLNDKRANCAATYLQVLYEYTTVSAKIFQGQSNYTLHIQPSLNTGLFKYTSCPIANMTVSFNGFVIKTELNTQPIKDFRAYIKQQLISDSTNILDFTSLGFAPPYQIFIQKSNISFNPSTYQLSGTINFILYMVNTTSSDIIDYKENINISYNYGWVRRKMWDGLPHTYHSFSAGATAHLSRIIQCISKQRFNESDIPPMPNTYFSPVTEGKWLKDSYAGGVYMEKLGGTSDPSDMTPNQSLYHTNYTINYTFCDTDNSVNTIITI